MDFSAYGLPENMTGNAEGFNDDAPLFENGDIVDVFDVNFDLMAIGSIAGHTPNARYYDVEIEREDGLHIERHNVCYLTRHKSYQTREA